MKIGIVGNGADKFTTAGSVAARRVIREVLAYRRASAVGSGHSPMGGVDLWAEDAARELGLELIIHAPRNQTWSGPGGYRARNLEIARSSDEVHVVVADRLPPGYAGRRHALCYHCAKVGRDPRDHVKSGACWTAAQAMEMGKSASWYIVKNGG